MEFVSGYVQKAVPAWMAWIQYHWLSGTKGTTNYPNK